MNDKILKNEQRIKIISITLFAIYFLFLIRIVLFKDAPLNGLFKIIGKVEQSIDLIPMGSVLDMFYNNVSIFRMAENIIGNIMIFVPFGMLIPIVWKIKTKKVVTYGCIVSLCFEIVQFCLACGASDIDDVIFNTLGAFLGYSIYVQIKKRVKNSMQLQRIVIIIVTLFGVSSIIFLFVTNTQLFQFSDEKVNIKNEEIVKSFIDTPRDFTGKCMGVSTEGKLVCEEGRKSSSDEVRTQSFLIDNETRLYICTIKNTMLFEITLSEDVTYQEVSLEEFMEYGTALSQQPVNIWSSDKKHADTMILYFDNTDLLN